MTAYPRDVADDWRSRAVCRGVDPEVFFTEESVVEAKAACAACPVAARCLEAALALDERYGVWGGLTRVQRARLPRQQERAHSAAVFVRGRACRDAGGTQKGYDRHYRAGEPPCDACREASRALRARRRAERDADAASASARPVGV